MLKNYFLITIRNLYKNPFYSLINILGLTIGIVCTILIMLWVVDETSYNKFIPKYKNLYQLYVNAEFDGKINSWRSVPLPSYEALKTRDANIKNTCVMDWGGKHLLKVGDTNINKEGFWVSEEFLEMFEYPLLMGDKSLVLDDASSIVISESLGKILFGEENPMGKTIRVDDESEVVVTGVLADVPSNSSFEFDFLLPWKLRRQVNEWVRDNEDNWGNNSFQVMVELHDPALAAKTTVQIEELINENSEHDHDMPKKLIIHPLSQWRLYSNFENGVATAGRADYVKLFTIIAGMIMVIACINFMNLATARSERRAREVGIRKSIGSGRAELIGQFMGESIFISTIAFLLALLIAILLLPFYNELVDKQLTIDFTSANFWVFSLSTILITGILSGSYPALYLSSFKPVRVLKGKVSIGKGASLPRQVLVVLQFGFSIILIIGTIVIIEQIKLAKNRQLGYNQDRLVSVSLTDDLYENYETLKTELEQSGAVESVTRSNSRITDINSNNFLGWPGKPEDVRVIFTTITASYDYCKTMGIDMLMGRDFSKDYKSDTAAIIINKAALDLMNLEDPIGTQLDLWGQKRELIGVTDNVLMGSVYDPVKPMFIILDYWGGSITMRLTGDIQQSLGTVEPIFKKHNPAYPFEYDFMDEEFARKFTTINLTSRLANIFAGLAIVITGLGLFGLAAYTAEQRTKEIGIRKVLGASVRNLVGLMSVDFTKLVILAFVVAAPLGYYLLNEYLQRYTLRIEIAWWVFPLTGGIALLFAVAIVSTQALRAAMANPAKSLRNE